MSEKKISIPYSFGNHPEKEDTIVITISGTGINLKNQDHKQFVETIIKVVSSEMIGMAMGAKVIHN